MNVWVDLFYDSEMFVYFFLLENYVLLTSPLYIRALNLCLHKSMNVVRLKLSYLENLALPTPGNKQFYRRSACDQGLSLSF